MQEESIGVVETPFGRAEVVRSTYANSGILAVFLRDADTGEPIAKVSVNLPGSPFLAPNHFFAKTYSENVPLVQPLLKSGLFEDVSVEGELFPIWRIISPEN